MLLQRLYNWIKYKSLPTSFLFKNRLFIERNTKHRRIYSVFGALLRNSKWGNFELTNLKVQFRLNYTKYLFCLFLFFLFVFLSWFFKKYYAYTYAFNSVGLFVWLSIDALDYYLSFSIWCVTALIAIATNWAYSYFLERVSLKKINLKKIFSNLFFGDLMRAEDLVVRPVFGTEDLKYVLYNWISENKYPSNELFLERFFESDTNKKQWENSYDFFIKLFRATYLCNLSSESYSIKYLHYSFSTLQPSYVISSSKKLINHYADTNIINKYSTLLFWYTLNNYSNYYSWRTSQQLSSLKLLKTKNNWNLSYFDNEISKYHFFRTNMLGIFYLPTFSFTKLSAYSINFSELWDFTTFSKNQINAAKWNRWLYKYSILHRRFLRNSHKITLTKKLFASGFYDNKFFTRNTWNSAHVKGVEKNLLHNLSSVYYKNLLQNPSLLKWQSSNVSNIQSSSVKKTITLFSFYENSYLWVTKRFYYFNTIPTNIIKSTKIIKDSSINNNALQFESNSIWSTVLNSYMNNLYSFNTNVFNISKNNLFFNTNYFLINENLIKINNYNEKDLYLIFDDYDLLTPELLDINYWVTNSCTTIKNKPYLLNYCLFPIFFEQSVKNQSLFKTTTPGSLLFNSVDVTVNPFSENSYLFDVFLISFFY